MKLTSILIAIDSVPGSLTVVQAASELALRSGAELRALFIEEEDWYKASRVSFSYQVSSVTGTITPLDEALMTKQSRAHSSLLERMIVNHSRQMNIQCTYQAVRGPVIRELMEAATGHDLIVIGRNRVPDGSRTKLGGKARFLVENCPTPVLVWNGPPHWPAIITGLVTSAEEKEENEVKTWTNSLGETLGRVTEFHSEDSFLQIRHSGDRALLQDRNRLLIVKRHKDKNSSSYHDPNLDAMPNSVLLI
jgi:nucleotide-binding universal stress UspA family protein